VDLQIQRDSADLLLRHPPQGPDPYVVEPFRVVVVTPAPFPTDGLPGNPCAAGFRGAEHTALKWGHDGELSAPDLALILERLTAVDPAAEALVAHLNGISQVS
jgi:hypothetical protein